MIKGLGDMAAGMIGDKISDIAGDAAGPLVEQIVDLVRGALAERDGGATLSDAHTGALSQVAEAFGMGSPEEVAAMTSDQIGQVDLPDNLTQLLPLLKSFGAG